MSINKPRILTWSQGITIYPLIVNGLQSNLRVLGVKYIIAILSTLKVTLLLLSQLSVSLIIALIPSQLLYIVSLVTYIVKSSIKVTTPPQLSIYLYTRSILKKRNRIRERGKPYSSLAYSRHQTLDNYLLIQIFAIRSKQNALTYQSRPSSIPYTFIL